MRRGSGRAIVWPTCSMLASYGALFVSAQASFERRQSTHQSVHSAACAEYPLDIGTSRASPHQWTSPTRVICRFARGIRRDRNAVYSHESGQSRQLHAATKKDTPVGSCRHVRRRSAIPRPARASTAAISQCDVSELHPGLYGCWWEIPTAPLWSE